MAIAEAARGTTIPGGLTLAIARVESGRTDPATGRARPWPWAVNSGGVGRYFATQSDAVAAVEALRASGVLSIDVGCMQVNLRHHPQAFASVKDAFDPQANARYAAGFLRSLYHQTGSWTRATAAYHSQTRDLGQAYLRRVLGPPITTGTTAPMRSLADAGADWPPDVRPGPPSPPLPASTAGVWSDGVPGLACPLNRC
jgi:Transglycosylase SLT domain